MHLVLHTLQTSILHPVILIIQVPSLASALRMPARAALLHR